jgi:hypothetical protein
MFVSYVLSGRGLYDGLITRPEESYWLWCVFMCDSETSRMRRSWPTGGCYAKTNIIIIIIIIIIKCGVYEEEEMCLEDFGKETWTIQTTWNIQI